MNNVLFKCRCFCKTVLGDSTIYVWTLIALINIDVILPKHSFTSYNLMYLKCVLLFYPVFQINNSSLRRSMYFQRRNFYAISLQQNVQISVWLHVDASQNVLCIYFFSVDYTFESQVQSSWIFIPIMFETKLKNNFLMGSCKQNLLLKYLYVHGYRLFLINRLILGHF